MKQGELNMKVHGEAFKPKDISTWSKEVGEPVTLLWNHGSIICLCLLGISMSPGTHADEF